MACALMISSEGNLILLNVCRFPSSNGDPQTTNSSIFFIMGKTSTRGLAHLFCAHPTCGIDPRIPNTVNRNRLSNSLHYIFNWLNGTTVNRPAANR